MRFFLILAIALSPFALQADYLKAYNNSQLRAEANANAEWIIGVSVYKGEFLEMLDEGKQSNGYYHVRIVGTVNTGYIYRNQVHRIKGKLPQFYPENKGVDIHIVDVGAGLGVIIKNPADQYLLYDGGAYSYVYKYLKSIHPLGDTLDYLIASHTDADHWGSIQQIVDHYQVNASLITSFRPGGLSNNMAKAKKALQEEPNTNYFDLADSALRPGTMLYEIGDFSLQFLAGFGEKNTAFTDGLDNSSSSLRNAASIVIKLQYKENSILFMGDAAGLKECPKGECDCEMPCIASEKFLLDTVRQHLASRIIVAGHHGARNSSCPEFIQAVNPEFVIFAAGSRHKVPVQNMYRTDIGQFIADLDDNPCNDEWIGLNKDKTDKDGSFDDHIRIQFTEHGRLLIGNVR